MAGLEARQQEFGAPGEAGLVAAARGGNREAIRALVQANNRRLFRTARAVLGDDGEAEDVVQEAYLRAFTRIDSFEGRSSFATWITSIALNEALGRRRRRRPVLDAAAAEEARNGAELLLFPGAAPPANPETETGRMQMRALLEELVDTLPPAFRVVFVLRAVEELSTEETAALLGIKPQTVKTRLHRARGLLRQKLEARLAPGFAGIFPFDGARCAGMADRVLAGLARK